MASRTVHSVCSHDCPDSCGILVTIDEVGKATRIQGDPNHPVTRGFLCGKVAKYLDRLLYPMKRRPYVLFDFGRGQEAKGNAWRQIALLNGTFPFRLRSGLSVRIFLAGRG
ncbi:MAG: hypothetical protein WA634_11155 [Silvibacterium sp.]